MKLWGQGILALVLWASSLPAAADLIIRAEGETGYDELGTSVAALADVNGDGFGDLLAGAPKYDTQGAAYIFFGDSTMDDLYDLRLVGENAGDRFGYSVASAGDVNGDGYEDIVVGAYLYDDGTNTDAGAAYIFFGGPSMDNTYDVKMVGENAGDHFGATVAGAGDVNGDGYADVIVGADSYDDGTNTSAGAAYIFFGGPSMDNTYDVKMIGEGAWHLFGFDVASAGDVNGDGYDDVIVGAVYYSTAGNTHLGAAYIFYGGSSMDNTYDVKVTGENAEDRLGVSVAGAGDVNYDGYDDIIVGAYGYDDGTQLEAGAAYVFLGGNPMDNAYDVKMVGETDSSFFGYAVSGAGYINNDSLADVLIGAYGYDVGANEDQGAAYVFFGGNPMDAVYEERIVGEAAGDEFGRSVSGGFNVNQDPYDDLAMGAHLFDDGIATSAGAAYVYKLSGPVSVTEGTPSASLPGRLTGTNPSATGIWNVVEVPPGTPYGLYLASGRRVQEGVVHGNTLQIRVSTRGVYFLRVGSHTWKLIKR